ncbi:hypothetical protein AERO9A_250013 [Aeromonas salmonicida]|nr:hypothetical protein AERO9A_250013 [Aeromonas salmonicida]
MGQCEGGSHDILMARNAKTRRQAGFSEEWWREKDSNLRRQSRQIYSLIPLAAREPLHGVLHTFIGLTCVLAALEMVEGEGFEPSKAEPSDLQSDPFGRSGTPPQVRGAY